MNETLYRSITSISMTFVLWFSIIVMGIIVGNDWSEGWAGFLGLLFWVFIGAPAVLFTAVSSMFWAYTNVNAEEDDSRIFRTLQVARFSSTTSLIFAILLIIYIMHSLLS